MIRYPVLKKEERAPFVEIKREPLPSAALLLLFRT